MQAYAGLVTDAARDSQYLRSQGLQPNLLEMIGDCRDLRMLDVGCADGWLLDAVNPAEGYGCDIVDDLPVNPKWHFGVQDIRGLLYDNDFFDVVVASLVLMWFREVDVAVKQMFRVTKPGGKAVIALVHPYFYRTGEPNDDGDFVISGDLSRSFKLEGLEIGGVAGPVTYFYHSFPDYLNACADAGFRIRRVFDWFVEMEDYARHVAGGMDAEIPRTGKAPMYSFIECTKD